MTIEMPPAILVSITLNGNSYQVRKGGHRVAQLKALAGIPSADELAEIVNGSIVPLPQDGSTDIEGGEVFLSSPGSCPSS